LLAFALVCLSLVLTPGPNMMYLVSRSICQGPKAGLVSLLGVALGFLVYLFATAVGLSALLAAAPLAFDAIRVAGAVYLASLAWQALKPGGRSAFQVRELPPDPPRRLIAMGFFTNLLNPKAAMLYLSLLPQFIDVSHGSVLTQSLILGVLQISISVTFNGLIALGAGSIAGLLQRHPTWSLVQRWAMGLVLGALALRLAFDATVSLAAS
jgi:threonine/homoserine/homoserine lactone efflux protein